MKLKRILSLTLCLMMLAAGAAFAQEADVELEGFVTEIVEGGFVMQDKELGDVLLNVDDSTVLDGILTEKEIAVGQYVLVQYDGRLTRSLPPQAHADKVGSYVLNGAVNEFIDGGFLLVGDAASGDVIVHTEQALSPVYMGAPVTVYFDGVMAMSLPGQVSARLVVTPELTGVVSQKDEAGFTLTDDSGEKYRVLLSEQTLVNELVSEPVTLPELEEEQAVEIVGGDAEVASDEEDAPEKGLAPNDDKEPTENDDKSAEDSEPVQSETPVEIVNGDRVTVGFNGVQSQSLPAQVSALEVNILR